MPHLREVLNLAMRHTLDQDITVKPHQKRKRYSLQINNQGDIVVRTPLNPSDRHIQQMLDQHQQWIQRQQQKVGERRAALCDWQDANHMRYRGKKYEIEHADVPSAVFYADRIALPRRVDRAKFLRDHAALYLPERCWDMAQMMGLNPKDITIRKMRACWGVCRSTGVIRLNIALIQVPDWVSDYVMIHECAHLTHFNHSKAFWDLVNGYCDTVKEAKKWLKAHQMVLIS